MKLPMSKRQVIKKPVTENLLSFNTADTNEVVTLPST